MTVPTVLEYEITQCFTLLSTGKQEKKSDTINFFSPSRIRFFRKVPEKQKINFYDLSLYKMLTQSQKKYN